MTAGRPSLYQPDFAEQARKLCRLGATDSDVADFFGIGTTTFYRWRKDHPDFAAAVTEGKHVCDHQVEQALYRRAVGFEYEAVRVFMPAGAKAAVLVRYPVQVLPDVGAAQHWLRFRRPKEWTERREKTDGIDLAELLAQARARVVAHRAAHGRAADD
jgi:hypothetical protein